MGLRLDIVNLGWLQDRLEDLGAELGDFDDLWADVSDIMVEHVAETFETEGFGFWDELKLSTLAYKERHGYPLDPMIREGKLLDSLLDPVEAAEYSQGRSSLGTFTFKAFSWGTDVRNDRGQSYAEYHAAVPEHNIDLPVRDPIMVTPQLEARVIEAAERHLARAIKEAGL